MLLNSCEISSDGVFVRTVSRRLCGEAECYFTTHSNVLAVVPSSTAVAQRAPTGTLASRPFPQRALPRAPSAAFVLVVGASTFVFVLLGAVLSAACVGGKEERSSTGKSGTIGGDSARRLENEG